jgi:transcriptional regulator with PAS, ATPase and Fis domain
MSTTLEQPALIGDSAVIAQLRGSIQRVARSDAKVLITGESGSGKELVAQTLHGMSRRTKQPFAAVNCAGLSDGLLESELFGHVRGSFTGAVRDKPGKFESADGGTILMDEVGEMTLRMQGLLLRFVETGEIQKVGCDSAVTHVDVRVIAATNRNLREMASEGKFREDLFYRLNVIHLDVPPLRERRADIPPLVDHFLAVYLRRHVSSVRSVSSDALDMLSAYHWPGNVRELQNVMERLALTTQESTVNPQHLPADIRRQATQRQPFRERRRTIADDLFRQMMEKRESFWTAVHPQYMNRDIAKSQLRELVHKGLGEARGNYRILLRLFNMPAGDYKRFLNFLRKHDCQLPFHEYR